MTASDTMPEISYMSSNEYKDEEDSRTWAYTSLGRRFRCSACMWHISYSYLFGCCPMSDLFDNGELILGEAQIEPNIISPLPNKSDIGQTADLTTSLSFPPKIVTFYFNNDNDR